MALALAAVSAPAWAQDAATPPATAPAPISQPDATKAKPEMLTEIVVTARRKALEAANLRKYQSDTIIDSIVADEAGKLPDTSITEVLQRIPGVTIDRFASLSSPDQFSWEGTGIQVRGLSGTTGLLNGEEIFSANGGSGLNFNEVTPELLGAVDVYKDSVSDMIEGGLAGTVDLRTHMPFDYKKPTFEAQVSDSYGDLVKRGAPSGSFLVTDRWDTPIGEIGALVDVAHTEFRSGDSFIRTEPYYNTGTQAAPQYIPGGFDYGEDQYDRQRTGIYEALQWKPNDQLSFWQTAFYSNYKQTNSGGGVYSDTGAGSVATNATFNSQNIFQSGTVHEGGWTPTNDTTFSPGNSNNYTPSNNSTADFSQGFTWKPTNKLTVSGAFQYVNSGAYSGNFALGISGVNLSSESLALSPNFKLPQDSFGVGASQLSATTNYVNSIQWTTNDNDADMKAVHVDVEYKFDDDSFFKAVKFGARYADRHETDNFEGSYWSALNESWDGHQIDIAQSPPGEFELYKFPNFFGGAIASPGPYWFATQNHANDFNADIKTFGAGEYPNGTTYQKLGTPSITNTAYATTAAYVKVGFGSIQGLFGVPFTGNFGVRVVENQINSSGNFTASPSNGSCFYLNAADAATGLAAAGGLAAALATAKANGSANSCYLPDTYGLAAISETRTGSFTYVRALPSFNIDFKPTSAWVVRFAVNQTMTPANYNDLRASGSVGLQTLFSNPGNVGLASGVQGLPGIFNGYSYSSGVTDLKPEISTNEDLSIEWYPNKSLSAHIDIFNKDIKDQIIYNDVSFTETFPLLTAGSSAPVNLALPVSGQADENASKTATIYGFEAGFRDFFDFLPGPFSGLGFEANYTDVESKSPSSYGLDINGNPINNLPVVALSHSNYNANLLYDKGPWDARLAWSWRSRYLATTTGNGTTGSYGINGTSGLTSYALPVYGAAYGELDASASYKINDHWKVQFSAANLTNTIARTEMEILQGVFENRSWYVSDRRYEVALHVSY
jgi:TonB-dependent receptor